jgi:DNA repair protein RecO (recombination protein O)
MIVTKAVVARSVDYGEADRILTFLTESHGKISAVARSAKKSRRRYGGALSLFVIGEATLRTASRRGMLTLERFEGLEDLSGEISSDVVKLAHGSYILESARELWGTDQPDPECFDLVCESLRALASGPPSASLLRAYELQLLGVVGLGPSLDSCVACGGEARPEEGLTLDLDVAQGGVICSSCTSTGERGSSASRFPMHVDSHRTLLNLQTIRLSRASGVEVERSTARQIRELMLRLMRHHLGKDLRSLEFLVKLAGQQTRP